MIHYTENGKLRFDNNQDVIDYVLSDDCDFKAIDESDSLYYTDYYPDETEQKLYLTVYNVDNEPIITWCCEDQEAHIHGEA